MPPRARRGCLSSSAASSGSWTASGSLRSPRAAAGTRHSRASSRGAAGRRRKGNTGSRAPTSRPGWRTASRCGCRTQTPAIEQGEWLRERFEGCLWVAVELTAAGRDRERLERLSALARELGLPAVAAGDVHMHQRRRRATAGRADRRAPEDDRRAGGPRAVPERRAACCARLRGSRRCTRARSGRDPGHRRALPVLARRAALRISARDRAGGRRRRRRTCAGWSRRARRGAGPRGCRRRSRQLIEHELALIAELGYERYFLTVHDIVAIRARTRHPVPGPRLGGELRRLLLPRHHRGRSRAHVDAVRALHLARAQRAARHRRRLRARAARGGDPVHLRASTAATAPRSPPPSSATGRAARCATSARRSGSMRRRWTASPDAMQWWDGHEVEDSPHPRGGLRPGEPARRAGARADARADRLSAASVAARRRLRDLARAARRAGADRERGDAGAHRDPVGQGRSRRARLLKVDVLGLGMLTRSAAASSSSRRSAAASFALADIPAEDPARLRDDLPRRHGRRVPDRVARADGDAAAARAAQLLRPRHRGGDRAARARSRATWCIPTCAGAAARSRSPIRARRSRGVLERTLGVPIFQEQVMQLAIVAAGFTPGEADQLRRAMAAWKRKGGARPVRAAPDRRHARARLRRGLRAADLPADPGLRRIRLSGVARRELRAAGLRLGLAQASEPAAFCCALLNSQPMGFYAPAQLVRDARTHGVEVRAVDVNASGWDCTLERGGATGPRCGWACDRVQGLAREAAERIVAARAPDGVRARAGSRAPRRPRPARPRGAGGGRRARRARRPPPSRGLGRAGRRAGAAARAGRRAPRKACRCCVRPREGEDIVADYRASASRWRAIRWRCCAPQLAGDGWLTAAEVAESARTARRCGPAGIVITRQRPRSAGGVMFVTLEDETGYVNLVVWSRIAERTARRCWARLLGVRGRCSGRARSRTWSSTRLEDRSALLGSLVAQSRELSLSGGGSAALVGIFSRRAPVSSMS